MRGAGSNVDNIDINILIDQWLTEHAREDRTWDREVGVDVQFDKWEDVWYNTLRSSYNCYI